MSIAYQRARDSVPYAPESRVMLNFLKIKKNPWVSWVFLLSMSTHFSNWLYIYILHPFFLGAVAPEYIRRDIY